MNWRNLIQDLAKGDYQKVKSNIARYNIYANSLREKDGSYFFIKKINKEKRLVIVDPSDLFLDFIGEKDELAGVKYIIAPLNHENAEILRGIFQFTNPQALGKEGLSLGLGDRLGLASAGHIKTVQGKAVKPVLAQQSIRELDLTDRTYADVLDAASWAVFQEGYKAGFGADGDHLKNREDIQMALELGFSMLTLDCSEHIPSNISNFDCKQIKENYNKLLIERAEIKKIEEIYLNKDFRLNSAYNISFNELEFKKIVLTYLKMLDFIKDIYQDIIAPLTREIDFEVSIDETETPTSPQAHYFVASELKRRGIKFNSLAPRFCGQFQKGIDYIGDIEEFETEFKLHAQIAANFDYKLSIHSGSDKFSVFPIIGKYTKGRVHVKTAGTNWLEAIRIVAEHNPKLYRAIHEYALDNFSKALKYYHVTSDINNIPKLANMEDENLHKYLDHDDARQLLHITYGLILQAKDEQEKYLFRDQLYQFWAEHEKEYAKALEKHIAKHISSLGF